MLMDDQTSPFRISARLFAAPEPDGYLKMVLYGQDAADILSVFLFRAIRSSKLPLIRLRSGFVST
jgi:hypothetical protein